MTLWWARCGLKTSVSIVCSTVCSGADQGKHQRSASLAFMRRINWWPVNFPYKGQVTRKMFPLDDVILRHNAVNKQITEGEFNGFCIRCTLHYTRHSYQTNMLPNSLCFSWVPFVWINTVYTLCKYRYSLLVNKIGTKLCSIIDERAMGATPDSKVHQANMGLIWGRQDPGGSHVGPMNLAIWGDQWIPVEMIKRGSNLL